MSGQYIKVIGDAAGAAQGYVTVQGKDYNTATAAIVNGGATGTTAVASNIGDIASATNANAHRGSATANSLALLDKAIASVDNFCSRLGATQNRLNSAVTNLNNTITDLSAAQSHIQEADYATEVSSMSKAQIVQQAGNSVLGKANQVPQQVQSLLQG